jgi:hypothetical protein
MSQWPHVLPLLLLLLLLLLPLSSPCSLTGGNFDAAAMASARYLPVESAMPGTTLGLIPLQAFETGGTLYGELC